MSTLGASGLTRQAVRSLSGASEAASTTSSSGSDNTTPAQLQLYNRSPNASALWGSQGALTRTPRTLAHNQQVINMETLIRMGLHQEARLHESQRAIEAVAEVAANTSERVTALELRLQQQHPRNNNQGGRGRSDNNRKDSQSPGGLRNWRGRGRG